MHPPSTASRPDHPDGPPQIKRVPPRALRALRLLLAPALLAAVLAAVGPAEVASLIAGLDWRFVAAAVLVGQAQMLLAAWRWRYTAARLGHPIPLGRAFREYALSVLVNMTVPGGVAGDALRGLRAAPDAGARIAIRSVALERISGQAAFLLVAAAGALAWIAGGESLPAGVLAALALAPLAALAGLALLALAARRGPSRVRHALDGLAGDAAVALGRGAALPVQAAVSILLAVSYVAVFALAGHAVGAPLPLAAAATLIPIALLAMLVPVGVGGLGLREGAAALLWPLAGLAAAEGATTAAVYGLVVTVSALPGLAALAGRTRPSAESLSARTA